jgi:hypothetical protein
MSNPLSLCPRWIPSSQYSKMSSPTSMSKVADACARAVVQLALDGGSIDDISVIVNV